MATVPSVGRCGLSSARVSGAAPSVSVAERPSLTAQITASADIGSSTREKIAAIKDGVCRRHGITEEELVSQSRIRRIANARSDYAYLLRVQLGLTPKRIGKEIGGRSPRTIIQCINQRERKLARLQEDIA